MTWNYYNLAIKPQTKQRIMTLWETYFKGWSWKSDFMINKLLDAAEVTLKERAASQQKEASNNGQ